MSAWSGRSHTEAHLPYRIKRTSKCRQLYVIISKCLLCLTGSFGLKASCLITLIFVCCNDLLGDQQETVGLNLIKTQSQRYLLPMSASKRPSRGYHIKQQSGDIKESMLKWGPDRKDDAQSAITWLQKRRLID